VYPAQSSSAEPQSRIPKIAAVAAYRFFAKGPHQLDLCMKAETLRGEKAWLLGASFWELWAPCRCPSNVRLGFVAAASLCSIACTSPPQTVRSTSSFHEPSGPHASVSPLPTAEPQPTWVMFQRNVLMLGQSPDANVRAGAAGFGRYNQITAFTLSNPDGSTNTALCDEAKAPRGSSGFGALSFECHSFPNVGRYVIRFNPADTGFTGPIVDEPLRYVSAPPATPAPPDGWAALPLAERLPSSRCYAYGESYEMALVDDRPNIKRNRRVSAKLPQQLATRLSPDHAQYVTHVFEDDSGWLVMFDHGEFGGGIEWFERQGGEPRQVHVGPATKDAIDPQNVNQALADGSSVYVLQGISHLGISEGQLAKVWREHEHFTSHVIARYASEPVAWVPLADGFLVTTWEAIWHTKLDGTTALVSRLPDIVWYPTSLARASDGTLYVGIRGGVLRLTPTWPEQPRYVADYLWPTRSGQPDCLEPEESNP
jgi:hypothetical protein